MSRGNPTCENFYRLERNDTVGEEWAIQIVLNYFKKYL